MLIEVFDKNGTLAALLISNLLRFSDSIYRILGIENGNASLNTDNQLKVMNVQFLSNEKGKKTAVVIPIKDWEEIQQKLNLRNADFMEDLPEHVKAGILRGQNQSLAGETKSNDEVMKKYTKYL